MIRIRRGLDLDIPGRASAQIEKARPVRSAAMLGPDLLTLKPKMAVAVGDQVRCGDVLFHDKSNHNFPVTSPAGGKISAIHRGARRALLSVVIDIAMKDEEYRQFELPGKLATDGSSARQIRQLLWESGLWSSFKTRPYSYIPAPDSEPQCLFVNTMDSNPLSADTSIIINHYSDFFSLGLTVIAGLFSGPKYLCREPGVSLPTAMSDYTIAEFAGPHPSGLSGTHIHHLAPASANRTVWSIDYQDVIAIGHLFTSGQLMSERIIALAGPSVTRPRLLKTRMGASLSELCAGELTGGEHRIISGSVLSGRESRGALAWLGRYHSQVSVLPEGREREFLGWLSPGKNRHSSMKIYLSGLFPKRWPLRFNTSRNGSERAMVPTGNYERVMPLNILPTHLLRYLLVGDSEMAQQLGCLELDEEDLALCTYVCSGKYEYAPILREMLNRIAKEG